MLTAEQGYGDMIQFCRFLPDLIQRAGAVVVEMPPPLVPLVAAMEKALKVIATDAPPPPFDVHCPMMSLPLALATRLETIPGASGYLRADPGKIRRWRERLGGSKRPRVGLVWHTTSPSKNSPRKSVPWADLRRHLPVGADYVSLQREHAAADRAAAGDLRLFGDDLHDFSETAALIAEMDLVISIDTSAAHLAGALGKPVWLLLHTPADWRWLDDRQDSPWYAHMRLYRQTRRGDWAPVSATIFCRRAWPTTWPPGWRRERRPLKRGAGRPTAARSRRRRRLASHPSRRSVWRQFAGRPASRHR